MPSGRWLQGSARGWPNTRVSTRSPTRSARARKNCNCRFHPREKALGVSLSDLGRQVRQAFYGEEAQRVQRGREDVRIMVRFTEQERQSLESLYSLRIRTADGRAVPFRTVAEVTGGRGLAAHNADRRQPVGQCDGQGRSIENLGRRGACRDERRDSPGHDLGLSRHDVLAGERTTATGRWAKGWYRCSCWPCSSYSRCWPFRCSPTCSR